MALILFLSISASDESFSIRTIMLLSISFAFSEVGVSPEFNTFPFSSVRTHLMFVPPISMPMYIVSLSLLCRETSDSSKI
jgi:hypothetical protein